ncbi:MAG: 3-keto-5-aminohexanoate cleavage protein [Candidatus Baldrarchaeia archaeon]
MAEKKLIITCAITGAMTIPSQTPYLPITPEQISDEVKRAYEAGAAIVHIHARDPDTGAPTSDLKVFKEILAGIKKKAPDVVVCLTTGGSAGMTTEERICVVPEFEPEVASFNMGSMNFSFHPRALQKLKSIAKQPWEKALLDLSWDFVFKNTFKDLEYFCKTMLEHKTKPELEIYDVGHIYNARILMDMGLLKPPLWIQFVTGVVGGVGGNIHELVHLKETADRVFGPNNYDFSVIGIGYPWEFEAAAIAIAMGGHVRVGLEDNIFIKKGELAKSNAELVAKVVRIAEELGRDIAAPDDVRKMLGLKGKENTKWWNMV